MKKFFAAFLVGLFAVLSMAGCAASGIQGGTQISIGQLAEFNSINGDNVTGDGSRYTNEQVSNLLNPSFFFTDTDGSLVANKEFGSVEVISRSPFKVRYSLAGTAKWSDGQQVNASDLLLSWLAAKNPLDSGFNSVRAGSGLRWATSLPEIASDHLAITLTFEHPVSDYRTLLTVNGAAHVVTKKAFDLSDNQTAINKFDQSVLEANLEDQKLIAQTYADTYLAKNLGEQPGKIGAGPYLVESYQEGKTLVLKANATFAWGPLPKIETINIRFYSDATAILAAMHSGKVDLAAPQESGIATMSNLVALAKSSGVTTEVTASGDIEAVLINFASQSVFSGESASALRKAFLNLIPVAKIQNRLSTDSPVIKSQSWIYPKSSSYYQPFIESNGSAEFDYQNAELASELLSDAGVRKPVDVRVLFDSDNPRARDEYTLLGQYANSVGFNLIDVSSKDPRAVYTSGEFDIFISNFTLAAEVGGDPYWFTGNGITGFVSTAVDSLLAKYSGQSDATDRVATLKKLDAQLYAEQFGLPLYQVPTLLAHTNKVTKLEQSPTGASATYGYWNWAVSN